MQYLIYSIKNNCYYYPYRGGLGFATTVNYEFAVKRAYASREKAEKKIASIGNHGYVVANLIIEEVKKMESKTIKEVSVVAIENIKSAAESFRQMGCDFEKKGNKELGTYYLAKAAGLFEALMYIDSYSF